MLPNQRQAKTFGVDGINHPVADKPAKTLLMTDFKEFHLADHRLGISQIMTMDAEALTARKEEFLREMKTLQEERKYDMTLLMITDVLREGTELLFTGDREIIRQAFFLPEIEEHSVFLKGVVSRKKQMVPALAQLWG